MSNPVVVSGEASETDSDEEFTNGTKDVKNSSMVQGFVITGEDSESENENDQSIASAVSALNQTNIENSPEDTKQYDSLLYQKLRENNARLHKDIESFSDHCIDEAQKSIDSADRELLKSQITLQGAVTSLKSLSVNSLTIKNKLHSLLSAKFLPNVRVKK